MGKIRLSLKRYRIRTVRRRTAHDSERHDSDKRHPMGLGYDGLIFMGRGAYGSCQSVLAWTISWRGFVSRNHARIDVICLRRSTRPHWRRS